MDVPLLKMELTGAGCEGFVRVALRAIGKADEGPVAKWSAASGNGLPGLSVGIWPFEMFVDAIDDAAVVVAVVGRSKGVANGLVRFVSPSSGKFL